MRSSGLNRWERKVARDASLRPRGKVYQTHVHVCICTKRWLCKLDHGLSKSGEDVLCIPCIEKKRAIEAERNSGEQMYIDFEPEKNFYKSMNDLAIKHYEDIFKQNLEASAFWMSTPYKPEYDPKLGKDKELVLTAEMLKDAVKKLSGSDVNPYPGNMYKPWDSKFWVSYKIMYDVQKGYLGTYTKVETDSHESKHPESGKVVDAVITHYSSYEIPFYGAGLKGELQYPEDNEQDTKNSQKYIPADKSTI